MKIRFEIELDSLENREDSKMMERLIIALSNKATEKVNADEKSTQTDPVVKKSMKEKPAPESKSEAQTEPANPKMEEAVDVVNASAATQAEQQVSVEDIRQKLALNVAKYREEIRKKLNSFGAGNFTSLDPKFHAEFYAFLCSLE